MRQGERKRERKREREKERERERDKRKKERNKERWKERKKERNNDFNKTCQRNLVSKSLMDKKKSLNFLLASQIKFLLRGQRSFPIHINFHWPFMSKLTYEVKAIYTFYRVKGHKCEI